MENNEKYSCVDCIWHDQCESDKPCDFFDRGQSGGSLTDGEIEIQIEHDRFRYTQEYEKYIDEFSDGNVERTWEDDLS